ncbi:MAG: hypothetical protein DRN71_00545 [Candidatus Nanohalarchaeota archaeon]|nr:MAG: hypothetical protein DRN71_00545 [Candidatus Nanohaloarchaeota archaeon]
MILLLSTLCHIIRIIYQEQKTSKKHIKLLKSKQNTPLKTKGTPIEEGPGNAIYNLVFKVTKIEGDTVTTNSSPETFNKQNYAPFNYEIGTTYFRDIWENGEFVTDLNTHETYFLCKGTNPIKVYGNIDNFINKIQKQGKQNKFERLLSEDEIEARIRTHAYDPNNYAIADVVLAETSDWLSDYSHNPFETYGIMVNLTDSTGRIVEADYSGGQQTVLEKNDYREATTIKLPEEITDIITIEDLSKIEQGIKFKPISTESMNFIRENCYRHS